MKRNIVSLKEMVISKADMGKLRKSERLDFVVLSSMRRDLTVLHKFLIYATEANYKKRAAKDGIRAMQVLLITSLMGKIHEMFVWMESKTSSDWLPLRVGKDVRRISRYFRNNRRFKSNNDRIQKLFAFVRNNLSFHYAKKKFEKRLWVLNEMSSINIWLADDSYNDVFTGVDTVVLHFVFDQMIQLRFRGSKKKLFETLMSILVRTTGMFLDYSSDYLDEVILKKMLLKPEGKSKRVVKHSSKLATSFFCKI